MLSRRQRAAVDAGGVYLQFLLAGVLGALYLVSEAPALLSAIMLTHVLMLHTLNPVLKFDGYWLLSDLAGIHNLHRRVRDAGRKLLRSAQLARNELALFAAFTLIALCYFAYLLAALGRNLGFAVASFLTATSAGDLSVAAALAAMGRGVLLALMAAMAFGVALLLARAGGAVLTESSNES
jgi:putative peptide zinc metalloprotease protein